MTWWMDGPILFLDIDGVLNSRRFARAEVQRGARGILGIDREAIPHLQRIVDETDCAIVLSSSWRLIHSLADMRGKLIEHGMRHPCPIRDRTPSISGRCSSSGRGMEVNAWISKAGFEGHYVCLDDDSDFLPGQNLVQTDAEHGLTAADADACIRFLRGTNR